MKNKFNKIYSNLNMDKQTTISNQLDCMISGDWGKDKLEKNYQSCVKCIRGADIPNAKLCNYNNIPERYILEKNNLKCKLKTYDIIIELSGGSPTQSTGRCCIIPENVLNKYDTNFISTNFCKVLRFKNKEMAVFSYLLLSYWYDSNLFFNYEIGTTGLKNLNLDAIINFDIKQPNIKILNEIFNYFNVCYNQIVENAEKLKKLNQLKQLYLKKFFG